MKKIYTFAASLAAVVMLAGIMTFLRVSAAAATVLPTDVNEPRAGCTFLGIEGKYIAQIQEALDRINAIRLEACKEGVENPSTGAPLTAGDYVPIQWSADLEYIARLRAAEASVTMDHARLNGESIWGITGPNGVRSFGEVIAWNWSETMVNGINQWYGEKEDWVKRTPGAVTGHYTQMIDPEHLYVGLGTFCSKSVKYYNTTVGEFSGNLNNPDTSRGQSTGTVIQTLEVQNSLVSYEVSGTDTLSVSPVVTVTDYWGRELKTGLTFAGGSSSGAVQWSSSNNDVATVSNGKVTVKKCGSAVITATMPDGTTYTKTVSYEHSYKTDSTTAATCKEEGRIVEKCTICGDTKTTTSPKTNKHSYKTSSTTAATCKEEGKTVEKCTVCGDTKTTTTPKTNKHSYGKWVTAKAPTASSDGLEKRTCSVCGTEQTRALKYDGSNTSSSASNSSGGNSSSTSSDDNSSSTTSDDNSSSTTSDDNSSSTTSDDNSSSTSSDDNSSLTSSDDNSSSTPASDNSSTVSSNGGSSASLSSDGSSKPSSGDEVQSEAASDNSDIADTSDDPDSGSSNKMLPFLIAGGGVLVAGAIGFVIFLLIKREKKLK